MSDASEQQRGAKILSEIQEATLKRAASEPDPEQLSGIDNPERKRQENADEQQSVFE